MCFRGTGYHVRPVSGLRAFRFWGALAWAFRFWGALEWAVRFWGALAWGPTANETQMLPEGNPSLSLPIPRFRVIWLGSTSKKGGTQLESSGPLLRSRAKMVFCSFVSGFIQSPR